VGARNKRLISYSPATIKTENQKRTNELEATPLREPYFSRAFVEHGGHLPDNWRSVVKLIDLTGLVECLTHEELPSDVEAELFALINATLAMQSRDNKNFC